MPTSLPQTRDAGLMHADIKIITYGIPHKQLVHLKNGTSEPIIY